MAAKWKCDECDWRGTNDQLLSAPNPFAPDELIVGCPNCKEPNTFKRACDHADCWKDGTCGTPSIKGYQHTCFEHRPTE